MFFPVHQILKIVVLGNYPDAGRSLIGQKLLIENSPTFECKNNCVKSSKFA